MALAEDPQLMRVVQDPTLMAVLLSGDLKAAEQHPGFKKLARDPRILAIMERVKRSMPAE